ncbi:MAG: divalent-cation tolerance protein CutA [Gammaproteobacteria bacterium]|nr:divalent-cation tolerance protein CutA [Gammaproteobacteria bacterium]
MPTINNQEMLLVMTTITDIDKAKLLARQVVEEQLAACCNIVSGVTSIYRWKDELCEDQECLLVMKTIKTRYIQLSEFILQQHPYETPELIALPIKESTQEYLSWVTKQTS